MSTFFEKLRLRRSGPVLGILAALASVPSLVSGQAPVVEPDSALAMLASGRPDLINGAGNLIVRPFREGRARYSPAQRQVLLDGVERVARGELQIDELGIRRSVTEAFTILRIIALDTVRIPEDQAIPGRVLRIYDQSAAVESKGLAVNLLADLLPRYPAYGTRIEALLYSVASAPPSPRNVPPNTAINALLRAGDRGVAVLRRLHEEGAVQHKQAAMYLRQLAARGYRRDGIPDGGE